MYYDQTESYTFSANIAETTLNIGIVYHIICQAFRGLRLIITMYPIASNVSAVARRSLTSNCKPKLPVSILGRTCAK